MGAFCTIQTWKNSCLYSAKKSCPHAMLFLILFVKNFIHVHVKCNITKKMSFLGLKFGIVKPLQSINYKLLIV